MRSWMQAMAGRAQVESEMDAELMSHLDLLTAELMRAGIEPKEAARRARIAMGGLMTHKEEMRAALGLRPWDEFVTDLRFGLRLLRKSAGFTAIAATSLALAIGANTSIFSVAKSLLYDRLHVDHPEQLRLIRWKMDPQSAVHDMWGEFEPAPDGSGMLGPILSYPVYANMRAHNQVMQDLFAFKEDSMNATLHGTARRVDVSMVSGNFYSGVGVRPQLGRAIQQSDDAIPGAGTVAVISDEEWTRDFGRSASVLGQTITVNQQALTIVGVNPRGFTGAKHVQASPDIFVPLSLQPMIDPKGSEASLLTDSQLWWVNVMGRLKPGVTDQQATAALDVQLAAATRATLPVKPTETLPRLILDRGDRGLNFAGQQYKEPVFVLMTLTGFVLLLACANVANLLLARGAQRQREMSVRLAMGAGRSRVLRQLLTESLLLAAIGGAGGLVLGYFGRSILPNMLSNAWEQGPIQVPMDWGVFAFATVITLLTGLLFGLAPAWSASRAEVTSSLKESAQSTTRRRKGLSGKALVGFQIALSTLLVVGAGLFLRTVLALNSVNVGFRTDHLVLFEVDPPEKRYDHGKDVQLHRRLEQDFAALPGVEGATPINNPYISDGLSNSDFIPEGAADDGHHSGAEDFNITGNTFFQTFGIPIIAGRGFGAQDTASSQKVAVINQALAKKRFPNANPVGKRFRTDGAATEWYEIVGVCGDTHYAKLRETAPPQFFVSYLQQKGVGGMTYAVRTQMPVSKIAPALRGVVQKADRDLPIVDLRTQQEQIDANMQMERTFAALTSGFGVLALALACVGIYGIMAYSVANRRNEIGIRMALGAQPGQVRGMILRESTWLALAGIVVGVGGALLLTRLVRTMLYGIEANDPATIAAGCCLLLLVALGASWIPARRAARVQPMDALRHE